MEQGEHHQENHYQLQAIDVVEDWLADLPTAETSGVESRQCMEALTQLDLETDMEEVGLEDQHPTIMKFFRKAMGIYEFQLTTERLEELGCTPKEVHWSCDTCDGAQVRYDVHQ
jgi:hypothetical protein